MWAVKFNQDTEVKDEGTLTATNDNFVYSQRINLKKVGAASAFVADAKAKFSEISTKKSEVTLIEEGILAEFNK